MGNNACPVPEASRPPSPSVSSRPFSDFERLSPSSERRSSLTKSLSISRIAWVEEVLDESVRDSRVRHCHVALRHVEAMCEGLWVITNARIDRKRHNHSISMTQNSRDQPTLWTRDRNNLGTGETKNCRRATTRIVRYPNPILNEKLPPMSLFSLPFCYHSGP